MRTSTLILRMVALASISSLIALTSVGSAAPSQRPLIFLPGILGSKLIDEDGNVIWGDRKSYFNFRNLTLPRNDSEIRLKPDGVIDAIPIVWPFKIKQYNGLRKTLTELGYVEGRNLFIFAYDWRRSNYKNASLLEDFIENTPALQDEEFDLIAHSMGGIISSILIQEHDVGERVENFITLGTPFYGSLNAFEIFLNGFSGAGGFMSEIGTSEDKIRSVMFSFESGYELLPSYENCCIQGRPDADVKTPVDLYEVSYWRDQWLPTGFSSQEDKQFIDESLDRGKKLRELISKEIPNSTELRMFAGDKFGTRAQVYFDSEGDITHFKRFGGDGTVWLQSATRMKQADARVSFRKHARIFDDKALKVVLGWILTPDGPLTDFAATVEDVKFESESGSWFDVDLVYFEVSPAVIAVGRPAKARLQLTGASISETDEEFEFTICVQGAEDESEQCQALAEVSGVDGSRHFEADIDTSNVGDFTIRLLESEALEDYFSVAETH